MNARLIAGHAVAAGLCTAVWEIGVNLPAGNPGVALTLAGAAPWAVAAISLAIAHDVQQRGTPTPAAPQQRRPQPARRKELTR